MARLLLVALVFLGGLGAWLYWQFGGGQNYAVLAGDPLVTEEHIAAFGWASQQDMDDILSLALRVNDFMSGVMHGVGIKLVDFKIEVGRIWDGDFPRLVEAAGHAGFGHGNAHLLHHLAETVAVLRQIDGVR